MVLVFLSYSTAQDSYIIFEEYGDECFRLSTEIVSEIPYQIANNISSCVSQSVVATHYNSISGFRKDMGEAKIDTEKRTVTFVYSGFVGLFFYSWEFFIDEVEFPVSECKPDKANNILCG